MIRLEPIIGVQDVKKSSLWYQELLGFKSAHGGGDFEMLAAPDDSIVLCLHRWETHDHPTLNDPSISPGNGLILYFKVDDLDEIWANAQRLNATIEEEPHVNQNSGKKEFSLRDLDNYYLIISF